VPANEDGGETAPSAAPTMGADGEMYVPPMDQAEMTEAASMEAEQVINEVGEEAQPQAQAGDQPERAQRPERPERTDRPERGDRGARGQQSQGQRGQARQQGAGGEAQSGGSGGDEPMGALAQALGAFMNRDDEEEKEEEPQS
jgi:hypothetical protein